MRNEPVILPKAKPYNCGVSDAVMGRKPYNPWLGVYGYFMASSKYEEGYSEGLRLINELRIGELLKKQ